MATPHHAKPAAAAPAAQPQAAAAPQHFLQRIQLFSALSTDDCTQVVKRMKRRDFPPNQIIVREGAPGPGRERPRRRSWRRDWETRAWP